jgi:hypothetical protein
VAAAEEFAHYPGNVASPEAKGKNRDTAYGLDENPYGGYEADQGRYKEYGGQRQDSYGSASGGNHVVWQGPTEEALHAHAQQEQQRNDPKYQSEQGHDYEYDQQRQMDAEAAAWRATQGQGPEQTITPIAEHPNGHDNGDLVYPPATASSWEPLSVSRDVTHQADTNGSTTPMPHFPTPPAHTTHDPLGAPLELAPPVDDRANAPSPSELSELAPPNAAFMAGSRGPTPQEGFYTPMTELDADPIEQLRRLEEMEKDYVIPPANDSDHTSTAPPPPPPPPMPIPVPVPSGRDSPVPMTPSSPTSASMLGAGSSRGGGGKISAAAFRRGAKPRMSGDDEESKSMRRLPVPPIDGLTTPVGVVPPTIVHTLPSGETVHAGQDGETEEGHGAYGDARRESDPPPVYAGESLR